MMNEARIGVGLGATCLGYTGYLHALDYARTRTQGRPLAGRDPAAAQVPIVEHTDVRRMLLAQKSYVEGGLALVLYCARLVDEQRTATDPEAAREAHMLLDVLTPIAKSWPSQWCLAANDLAIQVHGGYGYTRDYDRRAVLPGQPAQPDPRGHPRHPGAGPARPQGRRRRRRRPSAAPGPDRARRCDRVTGLDGACRRAAQDGRARSPTAGAHDGHALGDRRSRGRAGQRHGLPGGRRPPRGRLAVAGAGAAADGREGDFYDGKRQAARYFLRWELPRTGPQLDLLDSLDRTVLDTRESWL